MAASFCVFEFPPGKLRFMEQLPPKAALALPMGELAKIFDF